MKLQCREIFQHCNFLCTCVCVGGRGYKEISVQGNFLAMKCPCNPPPCKEISLLHPPPYKISVQGNFSAVSCELSFPVCSAQSTGDERGERLIIYLKVWFATETSQIFHRVHEEFYPSIQVAVSAHDVFPEWCSCTVLKNRATFLHVVGFFSCWLLFSRLFVPPPTKISTRSASERVPFSQEYHLCTTELFRAGNMQAYCFRIFEI